MSGKEVSDPNKIECPFVQVSDKNNCIANSLKMKHGKTKMDVVEWLRYQGFHIQNVEYFLGDMFINIKVL